MSARRLTRADILATDDYLAVRDERRAQIRARKADRRVSVGPYATFYFENFETMWLQVQEMLYIEKGGEAQIEEELAAYGPLVPGGQELVATLMFEIDDEARRARVLGQLGGVEQTITLKLGDETIAASPTDDVERTNASGKTSSVHFLRFGLTPAQIAAFSDPQTEALLAINHPAYPHMTALSGPVRAALSADFDAGKSGPGTSPGAN